MALPDLPLVLADQVLLLLELDVERRGVSFNWSLCAFVFNASNLTRANSLSTMTCCISRSCVRCFTAPRGFFKASMALFMVALSEAAAKTFLFYFFAVFDGHNLNIG